MKYLSRFPLFFLLFFICSGLSNADQTTSHFYDAEKEIQIDGTILKIAMEPRYKDAAPFIVLTLKQKTTGALYQVEVSPAWFFERNFFQGETLRVIGSLYGNEGINHIISRRIRIGGDWLILRDKHGFPQWRGGKNIQNGKGWRRKF